MIELKHVYKSFNTKELFSDINLIIPQKTKAGILGNNGCGKTTFLKMILGHEAPDHGTITFYKKHPQIGYMVQECEDDSLSVLSFLKHQSGIQALEREMQELETTLVIQEHLERYGDLMEQFEERYGYEYERDFQNLLEGLGFGPHILHTPLDELSGGQKSKVFLTSALYKGKDLLCLDEPTNNLDQPSLNWLCDFLQKSNTTILIVSHQRAFLDATTHTTYELDAQTHTLNEFVGNYSQYKDFKAQKLHNELEEYRHQQETLNQLKTALTQTRNTILHVGKGTLKDNNKMARNRFLESASNSLGGKSKALETRIKNYDVIKKPYTQKPIKYEIEPLKNFGQISAHHLRYQYPKSDFSLFVEQFQALHNDRIAIQGLNGSGKTTFFKILLGDLQASEGLLEVSSNIKIGSLSQQLGDLPSHLTALDCVMRVSDSDSEQANKILSTFHLSVPERHQYVSQLSPGQRVKLILSLLKVKEVNTLLLDEPTNHLDIEAIEILENALREFHGILIIISHDRAFVEHVHTTKTYSLVDGIMRESVHL